MYCSKCGQKNIDGSQYCNMCGSRLEGPTPVPVLQPAHPPNKNPPEKTPPKKKPTKIRPLIFFTIIGATLLLIGVALVWGVSYLSNKQNPKDIIVSVHDRFRVVCGDGYEYEVIVNSVNVRGISFSEEYVYQRFGTVHTTQRPTDEKECVIMNITIKNVSDYSADTRFEFNAKLPNGAGIREPFAEPYYEEDKTALLDLSAVLAPGDSIRGDILLGGYDGTGVYKVTLKHLTYGIKANVTIELRVSK